MVKVTAVKDRNRKGCTESPKCLLVLFTKISHHSKVDFFPYTHTHTETNPITTARLHAGENYVYRSITHEQNVLAVLKPFHSGCLCVCACSLSLCVCVYMLGWTMRSVAASSMSL